MSSIRFWRASILLCSNGVWPVPATAEASSEPPTCTGCWKVWQYWGVPTGR